MLPSVSSVSSLTSETDVVSLVLLAVTVTLFLISPVRAASAAIIYDAVYLAVSPGFKLPWADPILELLA